MRKKTMNTHIFNAGQRRLLALMLLMLTMSGCESTPKPAEGGLNLALKQQIMKEQLESHIADYEAARPAIDRLVALESDLRTLVTQIARFQDDDGVQVAKAEIKPVTDVKPLDESEVIEPVVVDNTVELNSVASDTSIVAESDMSEELVPAVTPTINTPSTNAITEPNSPETIVAKVVPPIKPINQVKVQTVGLQAAAAGSPVANAFKSSTVSEQNTARSQDIGGEQTQLIAKDIIERAYQECRPSEVAPDKNVYGVHVSSFKQESFLTKAWDDVAKKYPFICNKGAVVKQVAVQNQVFYSLRVGPYDTKLGAKAFCQQVRQNKQYCRVTDFSGEAL